MMGGSTPNIDRIATNGMIFMDHYAQASCTAGRAAFITGQYPIRVGLATVGLPGSEIGLSAEDPTLAELLKPLGYAAAQFGKNHLGDRDEHLPTAHGFDEFFWNLNHLDAGEYAKQYDFPKKPEVIKQFGFGQRGVVHCKANGDGTQEIEDKGPFGRERQRTMAAEFLVESKAVHPRRGEGGQAVLRVAQLDPHALPDQPAAGIRRQVRVRRVRRRDDADGRPGSVNSSTCSTNSELPTTRW